MNRDDGARREARDEIQVALALALGPVQREFVHERVRDPGPAGAPEPCPAKSA